MRCTRYHGLSSPRSGAACRLSVGRLCRVAQRAIALFMHAAAQPCPPHSSLFCSPSFPPRQKKNKREKDSEPRSHHSPTPDPINPTTDKRFRETESTHHFLICPRERPRATLDKVIDHLCRFAWGDSVKEISLSSPPTQLTVSLITVYPPRLSSSKCGRYCILQGSSPASVRVCACVCRLGMRSHEGGWW